MIARFGKTCLKRVCVRMVILDISARWPLAKAEYKTKTLLKVTTLKILRA